MAQLKPNPKLLSAALTRFCCFAKSPFSPFLHPQAVSQSHIWGSALLCTPQQYPHQCAGCQTKNQTHRSPLLLLQRTLREQSSCDGVMAISSLLDAESVVWAPHRALCAGLPQHTWGSFCKGCCKAQGGWAVHSQLSLTLPCLTSLPGEHFFFPP